MKKPGNAQVYSKKVAVSKIAQYGALGVAGLVLEPVLIAHFPILAPASGWIALGIAASLEGVRNGLKFLWKKGKRG